MASSVGLSDIVRRAVEAVALERLEDVEERQVGLGDGLEEPALLEDVVVLGMADERQVGVEHERDAAACHWPAATAQRMGRASLARGVDAMARARRPAPAPWRSRRRRRDGPTSRPSTRPCDGPGRA